MCEFFSVYKGNHDTFPAFSPLHIVVLITICVIILSIIIFRRNLRQKSNFYRYWIAIISTVLECSYLIWVVRVGKWLSIEKYKPTLKSIRLSFFITNIYMLFMTTINYFLGSNYYYYYVFSKPAPNIPNPFMFTDS